MSACDEYAAFAVPQQSRSEHSRRIGGLMAHVVCDALAPFRGSPWAETDVQIAQANPDVMLFVRDIGAIPIAAGVMDCVKNSKVLVDCPGGQIVVRKFLAQKEMLNQTFSVLCYVENRYGDVQLRAFKGSSFNKMCSAARCSMVMVPNDVPPTEHVEECTVILGH